MSRTKRSTEYTQITPDLVGRQCYGDSIEIAAGTFDLENGNGVLIFPEEIEPLTDFLLSHLPELEEQESEKWQLVAHAPDGAGHTYRLPVPNGWLYRTVSYRFDERNGEFIDNDIVAQSTAFVPDFENAK